MLALTAPDAWRGLVLLERTDATDLAGLRRRVARYWERYGPDATTHDPLETARLFIERENQPRTGWLKRLTGRFGRNGTGDEPARRR